MIGLSLVSYLSLLVAATGLLIYCCDWNFFLMAQTGDSPFYSFAVSDIRKQPFKMSSLKGKLVLIVNVASKCGFTPQYKGLEEIYRKYKPQGLEIIGFPCNQFGKQEPEAGEHIEQFCQKNYGVSFTIMDKIDVNGADEHPLYGWLKHQKRSLMMEVIKWNFEKFLVDGNGEVISRHTSVSTPESLIPVIEKELKKLQAPAS